MAAGDKRIDLVVTDIMAMLQRGYAFPYHSLNMLSAPAVAADMFRSYLFGFFAAIRYSETFGLTGWLRSLSLSGPRRTRQWYCPDQPD